MNHRIHTRGKIIAFSISAIILAVLFSPFPGIDALTIDFSAITNISLPILQDDPTIDFSGKLKLLATQTLRIDKLQIIVDGNAAHPLSYDEDGNFLGVGSPIVTISKDTPFPAKGTIIIGGGGGGGYGYGYGYGTGSTTVPAYLGPNTLPYVLQALPAQFDVGTHTLKFVAIDKDEHVVESAEIEFTIVDSTITVIKKIINDNGGSLTLSDVTLKLDGNTVSNYTETAVSAGSHTVSEASISGYTSTITGDCASDGTITITVGQDAVCTITNNDIASSTITVIKKIINDNGGESTIDDVELLLDGDSIDNATSNTVSTGSHTVSEVSIVGYTSTITGDCASDGTITITAGQDAVCTITNNDIQSHIKVIKKIINNNGGTATIDDVTLRIDGTEVTNGTQNALNAGHYVISEDDLPGYHLSRAGGSGGFSGSGHVFVSISNGKVNEYDQAGTFVQTLTTAGNSGYTTGMAFDDSGKLYVTEFSNNQVSVFDNTGALQGTFGSGYIPNPESILFDNAGNAYVGHAGGTVVLKLDSTGAVLQSFNVNGEDRGSDWIDLAADQCTILYTSEGSSIKRFDVCTNTQLTDFTNELHGAAYALRILGNGNVLVADSQDIHLLDSSGHTIRTYDMPGNDSWFALNIDPDGKSFWSGDFTTSQVVKFDIDTGSVLESFNTGTTGYTVFGLVVEGEITASRPAGFSGDCKSDGTLDLKVGQDAICTITNDDNGATIKIQKTVVNDNGGSLTANDFTFRIDGEQDSQGIALGIETGPHTLSEDPHSGYTASVWGGDCNPDGTIDVAFAQDAVCTITNDDIASSTITVIKKIINDNGGTATIDDVTLLLDGDSIDNATSNTVSAGSHTVSEESIQGYSQTFSDDCPQGIISVSLGENKVCTITNDDVAPTITIIKKIINDNGGSLTLDDVTLQLDGNTIQNDTQNTVSVGTHTVSEVSIPDYASTITGDCEDDGLVSLGIGENKVCTITNNDIAPGKLTVIKKIVNALGGTATISDVTLKVNGEPVTSGTENSLKPGLYIVTENAILNYEKQFSGDCDSNGHVVLGENDVKVCTITNTYTPAKITVIKRIINDNSGISTIHDVTLKLDGTHIDNGTARAVSTGTHIVSEATLFGYTATFSGDCNSNGKITNVLLGDDKTCIITNDDIAITHGGTIKVVKTIINDNGGSLTLDDVTLKIDNKEVTSGMANSVESGTHKVSEDTLFGYGATIGGDCNSSGKVTINDGDDKICTITNNDVAVVNGGSLKVIKKIINDNGGSLMINDVTLMVDSKKVTNGTDNTVKAGTHRVTEDAIFGYAATFSGDCNSNGVVKINNGDSKVCTITNNDITITHAGTLTVVKTIINDNGGSLKVDDVTLKVDSKQVTNGAANTIESGTHKVSEAAVFGYTSTFSGDCDSNGVVKINDDDDKVCTITNNDVAVVNGGSLKVIKRIINDNGGQLTINDVTLLVDNKQVSNGTTNIVKAGSLKVSEAAVFGYATTFNGDCDSGGNIKINNGDSKVCTITNNDIAVTNGGSITVIKNIINDNGGVATLDDVNLMIDKKQVSNGITYSVASGNHKVSEDTMLGYTSTIGGDCDSNGAVKINNGDNKVCTITNNDITYTHGGTIKVVKTIINDNGGSLAINDVTLKIDSKQVTNGIATPVESGTHKISEGATLGYDSTIGGDCNSKGWVKVNDGDDKVCTITNNDIAVVNSGTITINTIIDNHGVGTLTIDDVTLTIDKKQVSDSTASAVKAGVHKVSEDAIFGYDVTIGGDCDSKGKVTVSDGDSKVCTITNDYITTVNPGTLTIVKTITNDNGGVAEINDVTLKVDGKEAVNGVTYPLKSGEHKVSESDLPGYKTVFSGDCNSGGKVSISPGDNKVCNVLNDDIEPVINAGLSSSINLQSGLDDTDPDKPKVVMDRKLDVNLATNIGSVGVQIPAGITMTANGANAATWDGVLDFTADNVQTTAPGGGSVGEAVQVGFGNVEITFDSAVVVTLPGEAGKAAFWERGGVTHEITLVCNDVNDQAGLTAQLTGQADPICKEDVGLDLAIGTLHFTTFGSFTKSSGSSAAPASSTGGGGGGSGGGGGAAAGPGGFGGKIANFKIDEISYDLRTENKVKITISVNMDDKKAKLPSVKLRTSWDGIVQAILAKDQPYAEQNQKDPKNSKYVFEASLTGVKVPKPGDKSKPFFMVVVEDISNRNSVQVKKQMTIDDYSGTVKVAIAPEALVTPEGMTKPEGMTETKIISDLISVTTPSVVKQYVGDSVQIANQATGKGLANYQTLQTGPDMYAEKVLGIKGQSTTTIALQDRFGREDSNNNANVFLQISHTGTKVNSMRGVELGGDSIMVMAGDGTNVELTKSAEISISSAEPVSVSAKTGIQISPDAKIIVTSSVVQRFLDSNIEITNEDTKESLSHYVVIQTVPDKFAESKGIKDQFVTTLAFPDRYGKEDSNNDLNVFLQISHTDTKVNSMRGIQLGGNEIRVMVNGVDQGLITQAKEVPLR